MRRREPNEPITAKITNTFKIHLKRREKREETRTVIHCYFRSISFTALGKIICEKNAEINSTITLSITTFEQKQNYLNHQCSTTDAAFTGSREKKKFRKNCELYNNI